MRLLVTLMALVAVVVTSVPSYAATKSRSCDKHVFEHKEWTRLDIPIVFVIHSSLYDLRRQIPTAQAGGVEVFAWSRITSNKCEVHMVDPAAWFEPCWVGHEIFHCTYGRWHTRPVPRM